MKYIGLYRIFLWSKDMKMMEFRSLSLLILVHIFCSSCKGQDKADLHNYHVRQKTGVVMTTDAPDNITRTLAQDRKGNIWMATFDGVFRYDGTSFTNMTKKVCDDRFFSVLENRKGNLWFGTIGSGVYYFDGHSFENFNIENGLINNEIVCIYEDKIGNIWFGANGGASLYDGKYFRNFIIEKDSIIEDKTGKFIPSLQRPINEINSIIEDKTGKLWFGTRNHSFVYDGKTFATIRHDGIPFVNVRWIIEDQKGNIWLGGNDGLWRYNGVTYTNITKNFVGYIYEDSKGDIWTSSQDKSDGKWVLSRYDENSLSKNKPHPTIIRSEHDANKGMIFGILEVADGSIWYGALDGVYRYDGNIIARFINK